MEAVFLKILNMSITASWLVLAVIALRFLLKKAPKAFTVILWGLVGIRLILPFSFESVLSLIPSAETVPSNFTYSPIPKIDSGIGALNSAINPIISDALAPNMNAVSGSNPMQSITLIAAIVWVTGIAAMLLYTLISYLRFRRKVREAAPHRENIYLCDGIGAPFILGVICPRIYLPSDIGEADMEYVIAHERAHLKRRDHLWKPLGFLLLAIYWFNPVLWIAYILLCRDIELACDEKVIRNKGTQIKKSYSEALVNCSVPRKMIAACPLAFGEGSIKGRIKSVLNYKKPAFWIIIVSIIACIAVAVCFLTNPKTQIKIPDNVKILGSGSEIDNVYIFIKEISLDTDKPYAVIEWENRNEFDENVYYLIISKLYDIQYFDNDKAEYISCAKTESAFLDQEVLIGPGETVEKTYDLQGFDLTKEGRYCIIASAGFPLSSSSQFYNKDIWVQFEISFPPENIGFDLPSDREIAKLMNIGSNMIDSLGLPAYGIIEGENTAVISVNVNNVEAFGEKSVWHDAYIVIVTESSTTYYEVGPNLASNDKVYLRDFDGDGSDEIVVQQTVAMSGGAGGYHSRVLKFENGGIKPIFDSCSETKSDTGFSSAFKDGFKVEISNKFTGYKKELDFSDTEKYKGVFYDESGKVLEGYKDENWILIDSFYQFVPGDVDNDGIYEITCLQYTSLHGHTDGIGFCKSVLKYDKNIGEFVVADAEFVQLETRE